MILAIDPGKNGAWAWGINPQMIATAKMPVSEKIMETIQRINPTKVVIEKQQLRHGDFLNHSAFRIVDSLIRNYHEIIYACQTLKIPVKDTTSQVWSKGFSVPEKLSYSDRKTFLYHKAKALNPAVKVTRQTSDALLMLNYEFKEQEYEQIRSRRFSNLGED